MIQRLLSVVHKKTSQGMLSAVPRIANVTLYPVRDTSA